jgi:hypothetical protein
MQGYWNDPERTAEAIDVAGWMHTGDLATLDTEGYCHIVGRIKDMVIRGGENIYPREIEEFLYRHPKIQDVQVFGVPDARYGEELYAWIKLRDGITATPDEVKEFCRGQIAHYKIPRYVKFVEAFPMTMTGKIQKRVGQTRSATACSPPLPWRLLRDARPCGLRRCRALAAPAGLPRSGHGLAPTPRPVAPHVPSRPREIFLSGVGAANTPRRLCAFGGSVCPAE